MCLYDKSCLVPYGRVITANEQNKWKDINTFCWQQEQFLVVYAGGITTVISKASEEEQVQVHTLRGGCLCVTRGAEYHESLIGEVPRFAWHTSVAASTRIQMMHLSGYFRLFVPREDGIIC